MKKIILILALFAILLISGCTQSIEEVKKSENIDKTVTVQGTVENTIKLGQLSGYTLRDSNGDTIGVSSDNLPKDGSTITVTGTLKKGGLLGYYIEVE